MEAPDPSWTVYSSVFHSVLQAAEHLGLDRALLLQAVAIDASALQDDELRFPVSSLLHLYEMAAERSQCPDLGLQTGRISFVNRLNLQLYMSTVCRTFRDYLNLMPSVLRFAGDIGEVVIHREDPYIRLEWHPLWPATSKQRFLSDEMLTSSAAIVNTLCSRPIPVVKAHFTYQQPADLSLLRDTFGLNLAFEQPVSCLYFRRESLDYPLVQLTGDITAAMAQPLGHLFEAEAPRDAFLQELREMILRLLPEGELSVDRVAEALNLSRRTLQRRLAERETQFQQVLKDVRSMLALRYLSDERLGITEIAFLLGYTDQSSFSSAFKSWHGVSPSDYRQR